ncbi:expressed unknown protein [Ectocarpus siliculosus]|uniref:Uncharacterized protein n=1 Tax=Ectocarpus siliculosus TaxID=2880 RepID=D8LLX3_ECTSI|nr:expressed unknown protein [Ectocarpus siliculosus]|eukprot:CBN77187.1 expressed unknown protein [Ectocarpus siliculosus]
MAAEGLPPGDHSNNDPLDAQSSIPDRVGSAAIRRRIDSIKRSRGAGKRTPRQDESIRWVASTESGHRARSTLLPRAVWVLIFNQGSGSFSSSSEPQRGLYCLWSKGTNSALAFEEREGALRYAFKLKEKGLGIPRPTRVSMTSFENDNVLAGDRVKSDENWLLRVCNTRQEHGPQTLLPGPQLRHLDDPRQRCARSPPKD